MNSSHVRSGPTHSDFKVAAGSARIARIAGAMDAIIAIVPRIASATTTVTGSIGFTPKSRLAIVRSRAADALTPIANRTRSAAVRGRRRAA